MKLCNDVITVFNTYLDRENDTEAYQPTIIKGVSWYCEIASAVTDDGLKAANKFTIRVPENADFGGRSYVSAAEFSNSEDRDKIFTFQQGDVIVHAEETEALSPSDLSEKYGEIVTILGVTDNRRAHNARHWKIVGG
ncbi:MAG: DUF6751 family protein [Bilifractor sp.]